jgi:Kae1-associated kinase Bud32
MRGAEAVIRMGSLLGRKVVVKERIAKSYRVAKLDQRLRRDRTRQEARLLNKAKLAGVECPTVLEVGEFELTMTFIRGVRPAMRENEAREAGAILARLHGRDMIHGDYTPANLIERRDSKETKVALTVIDFGLGFISNDVEDKATDVFTMLQAVKDIDEAKKAFLDGYTGYPKYADVMSRVAQIEKRVRYAV